MDENIHFPPSVQSLLDSGALQRFPPQIDQALSLLNLENHVEFSIDQQYLELAAIKMNYSTCIYLRPAENRPCVEHIWATWSKSVHDLITDSSKWFEDTEALLVGPINEQFTISPARGTIIQALYQNLIDHWRTIHNTIFELFYYAMMYGIDVISPVHTDFWLALKSVYRYLAVSDLNYRELERTRPLITDNFLIGMEWQAKRYTAQCESLKVLNLYEPTLGPVSAVLQALMETPVEMHYYGPLARLYTIGKHLYKLLCENHQKIMVLFPRVP